MLDLLANVLAENKISIFYLGTHTDDFTLVFSRELQAAESAWSSFTTKP